MIAVLFSVTQISNVSYRLSEVSKRYNEKMEMERSADIEFTSVYPGNKSISIKNTGSVTLHDVSVIHCYWTSFKWFSHEDAHFDALYVGNEINVKFSRNISLGDMIYVFSMEDDWRMDVSPQVRAVVVPSPPSAALSIWCSGDLESGIFNTTGGNLSKTYVYFLNIPNGANITEVDVELHIVSWQKNGRRDSIYAMDSDEVINENKSFAGNTISNVTYWFNSTSLNTWPTPQVNNNLTIGVNQEGNLDDISWDLVRICLKYYPP
ncbi:MAG: hypothetical protein ACE5K4_03350 [Candidatus Hydrothermarchaeota archaeon]